VAIGGQDHVELSPFLQRYGLQPSWIETGKQQRFSSAWTKLDFVADSREITFNGRRVFMGAGTVLREGALWIDRIDAEKLLAPLLRPQTFRDSARPVRRIVIDPGHGGRDGGTSNAALKLQEKIFTLDVAERLGGILGQQGFEVVQTRTDDRYLSLAERATQARVAKADLFVSLHFNAAGRAQVHGVETYVMTPQHQRSTSSSQPDPSDQKFEPGNTHDAWNVVLGMQVHHALLDATKPFDRGLKRARFAVLRLAECPAVLVEAGYLSNEAEARKIASRAYRSEIAQAVATGIVAYANQVLTVTSAP
jgi:N-acetylmuramoyl-L-alanine amidase